MAALAVLLSACAENQAERNRKAYWQARAARIYAMPPGSPARIQAEDQFYRDANQENMALSLRQMAIQQGMQTPAPYTPPELQPGGALNPIHVAPGYGY